MPRSRIVLLIGSGRSSRIVYHALKSRLPITQTVVEQPIPPSEFLKRRVKRLGVATVAGQVVFRGAVVPWLERRSVRRVRSILSTHGLSDAPLGDETITVATVNDASVIEMLQETNPSVIVVNGTRIIRSDVLSATSATLLNLHAGITPLYRGVHGGYWALAEGRRDACGVTVHLIDEGLDTGGIVRQGTIDPRPEDDFTTYPYLQLAAGIPLLIDAICEALEDSLEVLPPPPGDSRVWSHPTAWGYLRRRLRLGVR